MDIVCAKTGRHFSSLEAAKECVKEHNRCSACPYERKSKSNKAHFVLGDKKPSNRRQNILTQIELQKLMDDINQHLRNRHNEPAISQIEYSISPTYPNTDFRRPTHKKKANWGMTLTILVIFVLILLILKQCNAEQFTPLITQ